VGTKADFYVGKGVESEWLGSIAWDGKPIAVPLSIRQTEDEDTYRDEVTSFLSKRGDGILASQGWPWAWTSSHGTNYSYAYDDNCVWVCCYGSSWWKATADEPDHITLTRKAAVFPDMSLVPKIDSGIYIAKTKHP